MSKQGCIIVPYRDRAKHLEAFLQHYAGVLPIYVIEQEAGKPFNRAKLLNIGYLEYGHKYDFCIYHDVDMMAQSFDNYIYFEDPTHLATNCSQFNYVMPFSDYFGGVTNLNNSIMATSNGFSNNFWGWGAEDCEMREHLKKYGYPIQHITTYYECFNHPRVVDEKEYKKNYWRFRSGRNEDDGLSSCIYDKIAEIELPTHTIAAFTL